MKINIVTPLDGWILNKFGECIYKELLNIGVEATMQEHFDSSADINHYCWANDAEQVVEKQTTFMVTHVDMNEKLERIRELTSQGGVAVCMSRDTQDMLIASGIPRNRICHIHPAQDGMISPRKVILGFTHRTYTDNRKRESILLDVCREVSPDAFRFLIMGEGWNDIILEMKRMGFEVTYYPDFEKEKYNELIRELDYYCFWGTDEGSMGFLDAVAAGVGTIVTPQGYHLDTGFDITYPVRTIGDIVDVFHKLEKKRERCIRFASEWTWKNYTEKLLEIWKYMLNMEKRSVSLSKRGWYTDGVFSLLLDAPPCFPTYAVPKGCKIVLWGAGEKGKKVFSYLEKSRYCDIVLWVDSHYEEKQKAGLPVASKEKVLDLDRETYDFVFVAIDKKEFANEVNQYLLMQNIPAQKILLGCML